MPGRQPRGSGRTHPAQQRLPNYPVAFVSLELLSKQATSEKHSPHTTNFGIHSSERQTTALEGDSFQQL